MMKRTLISVLLGLSVLFAPALAFADDAAEAYDAAAKAYEAAAVAYEAAAIARETADDEALGVAYDAAYASQKAADEAYGAAASAAGRDGFLAGSPIVPCMMQFIPMVITFSILLILMGKFVWPVVLKALDERAEKIEGSLKKAEEAKIEAEGILNDSQEKLTEARKESAQIIESGKAAGESARQDVIKRAEEEASEVIARGYANVEAEKSAAFSEVKEDSAKLAVIIAEKILKDKITPDVDAAMIDVAIAEMGGSND